MPRISPDTLLEETEEELLFRQSRTGVLGDGHHVECHPNLDDPSIHLQQHRAVCLTRPHHACSMCPHNLFTLLFQEKPTDERYSHVACPGWAKAGDQVKGEEPTGYTMVELATCESRPFEFCASCPSKQELEKTYSADKTKEGWYSRYARLRAKEFEDDD